MMVPLIVVDNHKLKAFLYMIDITSPGYVKELGMGKGPINQTYIEPNNTCFTMLDLRSANCVLRGPISCFRSPRKHG